jgi:hypothetical protein
MKIQSPAAKFDLLDRFRGFICWGSLDGLTVGGDTGYTVAVYSPALFLRTGNVIDRDAYCYTQSDIINWITEGKELVIEFSILCLSSLLAQEIWLHINNVFATPPDPLVDHVGFEIINGDVFATNADGTTQKITDTGYNMTSANIVTRLKFTIKPEEYIKFYVNDILKVTHTENLPHTGIYELVFHVRTKANAQKPIYIGRVYYEKEY